ncbi:MAG: hypothetical protein AB8B80_16180 [Marinicellaceae bacterium]
MKKKIVLNITNELIFASWYRSSNPKNNITKCFKNSKQDFKSLIQWTWEIGKDRFPKSVVEITINPSNSINKNLIIFLKQKRIFYKFKTKNI